MPDITSLTNPLVKEFVRLRQRRRRDETGVFLIEGEAELLRAESRSDLEVQTILSTRPWPADRWPNAKILTSSEPVLEKVAMRGNNAGVIAIARQFSLTLDDLAGTDLVLVAEAIEKPGNLGTMLRTADAAGAAVVVCDPAVDLFSPQVVRASLGCLFTVPIAQTTRDTVWDWAKQYQTVVATPEAATSLYDVSFGPKAAIVVGSEHSGVSDDWKQRASVQCSIPMAGSADSLNSATAAAIVLYEAVRQQRKQP